MNKKPLSKWAISSLPEESGCLSFNPRERMEKIVRSRPVTEGISIDKSGTYMIDDGLCIARRGKGWLIKVSIADVPALIPHDDKLEKIARTRMTEENVPGMGVLRIWQQTLLDNYVSLHKGKLRPAITFSLNLSEGLDIESCNISRTAFENQGEYDDGDFSKNPYLNPNQKKEWRWLAQALYSKRSQCLSGAFNQVLNAGDDNIEPAPVVFRPDIPDGKLLIHEIMRLVSSAATDFFRKNNLAVPYRYLNAEIVPTWVSPDFDFDLASNNACEDMFARTMSNILPCAYLNAPMRRYTDYLTLKILGHVLSRQNHLRVLQEESARIAKRFNRHATTTKQYVLQPGWRMQWREQFNGQNHDHPLERVNSVKGMELFEGLKTVCHANGWQRPAISERHIQVQKGEFFFFGMKMGGGESALQAWSVSNSRQHAFESATQRLLGKFNP